MKVKHLLENIGTEERMREIDAIMFNDQNAFVRLYGGVEGYIKRFSMMSVPLRGMKNVGFITHKRVRQDRNPRNTQQWLHEIIDEGFNEVFDYRYRSAAVFCSTEPSREYGSAYAVFPVGIFKICFSPSVYDLLESRMTILKTLAIDALDGEPGESTYAVLDKVEKAWLEGDEYDKERIVEVMANWISNKGYKETQDVKKASVISQGNELMIACKEYIGIDAESLDEWANDRGIGKK